MDIKLDHDYLKNIIATAILRQLDDAKREELIRGAIQHLITRPKSSGYGGSDRASPLEEAFNGAIVSTAQTVVREMIEKDPTVEQLVRGVVMAGIQKIEARGYDSISDKVGELIGRAIVVDR